MRIFAPLNRLNPISRGALALAGILLTNPPAWSQTPADLEAMRSRATDGDPDALNKLGGAYMEGAAGMKADPAEALRLFRLAADKGFAPAQYNLGLVYESGRGVTADARQAFKYYLMAAEQGLVQAQFSVGNMYTEGRGVAQDLFEANLWYKQAADAGLPEAQFNLGLAYELGRGMKKDETTAARWYQQAADLGYAQAQFNLGLLYKDGRGVAKDSAAAVALYRAAAQQGFAPAQVNYGLALAEGHTGMAADPVQAFVWLSRAVQNGAKPQARDELAARLTADQLAAANRILTGSGQAATVTPPSIAPRDDKKLDAQVRDLQPELARARPGAAPAADQGQPAGGASPAATITSLQRDNARLNDEVTRSTRELLSLHQQLRTLRSQAPEAGAPATTGPGVGEAAQLTAKAQQAAAEAQRLEAENKQLVARIATLEALPKPVASGSSPAEGAEARQATENLRKQVAAQRDELVRARRDLAEMATLQQENIRLRQDAAAADEIKTKNVQLAKDNEQLTAFMNGNRSDLDKAQARVAELEKQLADATTVRTAGGDGMRKFRAELDDANRSVDKLNGTVAELTAANEKLEKDLDAAQKSTAAALAAQSQAVSAASPDSFKMEIGTLNSRIKELEAQVEEERTNAAREVSTLASQLQRTRETNKSLTDANRTLVAGKDSDTSAARDETEQLQARIKELTAAGDDLRRQVQQGTANVRTLTAERDDLRSRLADAQKVATVLPGLADEKAALQERLEAVGTQLVQAQHDEEELQKANADLTKQLATSQDATEKVQADLAASQGKVTDAEKAADAHTASVAELTAANTRLEQEKEDMRQLVESYRSDIARLNQNVHSSEQQRADSEHSGQQNIDALTAQMAQLRQEIEAARATQSRQAESFAAQERERSATIAQLRNDNAALASRLSQAQSTLDQIAAAARLGTPAAAIASGSPVPVARTTPAAEARIHTVAEGDSLSRISMRYYGTPNRWQEIYQANRDVLQGSSALRVGQQLRIP